MSQVRHALHRQEVLLHLVCQPLQRGTPPPDEDRLARRGDARRVGPAPGLLRHRSAARRLRQRYSQTAAAARGLILRVGEFYDRALRRRGHDSPRGIGTAEYPTADPGQAFERELRRLASTDARVLDIGCADGWFTLRMAESFGSVSGIDASDDDLSRFREGVPIFEDYDPRADRKGLERYVERFSSHGGRTTGWSRSHARGSRPTNEGSGCRG